MRSLNTIEWPDSKAFKDIIRFLTEHNRFVITSHARPDGDSIGSALALALGLESLGKTVDVVGADPHPRSLVALPAIDKIQVTNRVEGIYDGLLILECNDLKRPGIDGLDRYFVVNIDHHLNTDSFGNLNWVDSSAAAVGEMVYYLLLGINVSITKAIATNLYVAIFTDTGSFQYSNTSAGTFAIVADLVRLGVSPSTIAQSIHMNEPREKIRLLGKLLNTLDIHPSEKIASIVLTHETLDTTGASATDVEGLVNYPLSVGGVEMAVFFRQEEAGSFRVSLRSRGVHDVSAAARLFGGGGHKNAAGFSIDGNLAEVKDRVIGELEKFLV